MLISPEQSIFPGLGLGAILAKCETIPETIIHTSAAALAGATTAEEKADGMLYPQLERVREVSGLSTCCPDNASGILY